MPEMNPALAKRLNMNIPHVKPTGIREFAAECSKIPGIVQLTIGEPDFNVPAAMKQAAIDAINNNDSHYSPAIGTAKLREAASKFLAERYDLHYDPQTELAVTIGATEGIFAALSTFINEGDVALIPTPTFPLYMADVQYMGGLAVELDTSDDGFILTPEKLKAALAKYGDKVKALVLNYPANPTGVTYTADQLKALANVLKDTDVVVIADEIYSELVFDGQHTSIAKFLPGQTIVLNGASKSQAMTGYRIGIMAAPAKLMKALSLVHGLAITAPSDPAMAAATYGFGTKEGLEATEKMKAEYKKRRDVLADGLKKLGFDLSAVPVGAFYIFAHIPKKFGDSDIAFAKELAQKAKVALTPGSFFGKGGKGFLRISYAASMDNINEALKRMGNFLK